MDEKYYTPELEEFHVGFECEVYLKTGDPRDIGKFIKFELSWTDFCMIVNDPDWVVRVKYLDKEDIESCGFKLKNNKDLYEKVIIDAPTNYHNKIHLIKTSVDISIFQGDDETSFVDWACRSQQIKIKNKSELRILLKQLNILT